ncbi:hypothetical protein FRB94_005588 [Tulasnella sp. JGI-2019a]|nr:hypothetical protein FRB94_005588 [Tulasnella sp. JGI-2019a]
MGATIAAGFYKFIKYLEYETVIGPEADGEPVIVVTDQQQLLIGSHTNPSAPPNGSGETRALLRESDMRHERSMSRRQHEKDKGTKAVTGPGLGDLLTTAASDSMLKGPLDAPPDPREFNGRLERIEGLLSQLLGQRHTGAVPQVSAV